MQLGQASLGKTDLKVDIRQGKGFLEAIDKKLLFVRILIFCNLPAFYSICRKPKTHLGGRGGGGVFRETQMSRKERIPLISYRCQGYQKGPRSAQSLSPNCGKVYSPIIQCS